jgi:imidazolonepropionase-like amidohydrolase
MRIFIPLVFILSYIAAIAQPSFPVNGVRDDVNTLYAFTHASIYTSYNTKLENASILVKAGKILNIGTSLSIPKEAVEINCSGKTIYPSFIDAFTNYGMPETKANAPKGRPQFISDKRGAFNWNEAIIPEFNASENFAKDEKAANAYRSAGFGTVYTFKNDGIARGSGCVVTLNDKRENELFLKTIAGANYSFNKGSSSQDYPSSLMGAMALLRQTYYDAQWYKLQSEQTNISLKAFNDLQNVPQFFDAGDKWNVMRADKTGDEFKVQYIIKTDGSEYQRLKEIKATNATLIVPVNFPAPFNTNDVYDAQQISTTDMMHWYYAPSNLFYLQQSNIPFCITSYGCDANTFLKNLRKAIQRGLSEQEALKALTANPAAILNISDKVGSLKTGMLANFIITSGNIFESNTTIYENWANGNKLVLSDMNKVDVRGNYSLKFKDETLQLMIEGDQEKPNAKILERDTIKAIFEKQNDIYTLVFERQKIKYLFTGWFDESKKTFNGMASNAGGETFSWTAVVVGAYQPAKSTAATIKDSLNLSGLKYPFTDFGNSVMPSQETILFKNATIWTNEAMGKQEQMDLLVVKGKISQMGKDLKADNALVIDATGKHLTPGIVDEHSHIAIAGDVNEGTQSVTSEVRIGDVLWPEDINIYRQLAGGVTSSHLLHGSANTIGGQTQLIKLRWGQNAEQMKFEGWDGFIKFALGENVKQSNWGDRQVIRFPQTRMGVEQVLYDAFSRAKEYERQLKLTGNNPPVRKDLELDALVEIMNKKRFITCHSYVQSEINMLMHVGDSMGFKVNTFTHILEGYKVADKMKAHGANASTFADWWAYKFEVYDAIPYNAALMTRVGLNVAVNSDDPEMARRLNQEAAKSMKYGGLSAEEALKLCTLNPAKMLHVDNRIGSIKIGKDADLVLWSDEPLSIYAKPLYTLVDGIIYFDYSKQASLEKQIATDRAFLMQKMNESIRNGEKPNPGVSQQQVLQYCEGLEGIH